MWAVGLSMERRKPAATERLDYLVRFQWESWLVNVAILRDRITGPSLTFPDLLLSSFTAGCIWLIINASAPKLQRSFKQKF